MMADDPTSAAAPTQTHPRRASIAGHTFADLFGTGRPSVQRDGHNNSPPNHHHYSGSVSQAAAEAQKRRLSLTTLGLSGSPNSSPFGPYRSGGRDSVGSAYSASIDESAIEDDGPPKESDPASASTPATPFARRMSFGARALRDVKGSGGSGGNGGDGGGGATAGQNGTNSPPASHANASAKRSNGTISSRDTQKGRGSVDFWAENMRNRAERTSFSGGPGMAPMHTRAKSVAMESPVKEMPPAKMERKPDPYQERMLRGELSWD